MQRSKSGNTFYCFSPPVMIATFFIEISFAVYTLVRYKLSALARIAIATLTLLALFQLSEYATCGHTSMSEALWSRIGYVSITLLPPLGVHLIRVVSRRLPRWIVGLAYVTSVCFATVFGFSHSAFQSHICAGNYAIFQLRPGLGGMYFAYYYTWLIASIGAGLYYSVTGTPKVRRALVYQVFGNLSFLLPVGIVNAINPQTIAGIPSIMCGFAVIYAIVLTFGILPLMLKRRA